MAILDTNLVERLLENRYIDPKTNCWIWLGHTSHGYGGLGYNYKNYTVHRLSAYLYLGLNLDDPNQFACHKNDICNRKDCFNPDHLYVGNRDSNSKDYSRSTTHCKYGHEFNSENTRFYKNGRFCRLCSKLRHREERSGLVIGSLRKQSLR